MTKQGDGVFPIANLYKGADAADAEQEDNNGSPKFTFRAKKEGRWDGEGNGDKDAYA